MPEKPTLTVDVISDVVCPWCFVGLKRLEKARAAAAEIELDIRWRPYQLDPTIPPEGRDRKSYMLAKFGSEERLAEIHQKLTALGESEDIAFDFDAIAVSPNTLDAHRTIRWAISTGADVQHRMARRLFQLFFEEGADLGDHQVLIGAARDVGMDAAVVETLLATDADREAVSEEIATASRMGVTGVPCFLLDQRYAIVGAQDTETLADAFRKVVAAKEDGASTGQA